MGFNIGAFTRGLAQGLDTGMDLGEKAKRIQRQNAIDEAAKNGLAAAKTAREADIGKAVNYIAAEPEAGATPTYRVGEQFYTSQGAARTAAEKNVAGFDSYFAKNAVPFMRDAYLQQGDVTKAQEWVKYGESQKGRDALTQLGNFMKFNMTGDHDKAGKVFGQYYNQFIDDGVDYQGHELVKDDQGNAAGYLFKLKDKGSGKEYQQTVTLEDALRLAHAYSPDKLFESELAQIEATRKRANNRADMLEKSAVETAGKIAVEEVKGKHGLLKEREGSQLRKEEKQFENGLKINSIGPTKQAETDATVATLRRFNYTDDEIKSYLPGILKVTGDDRYRKATSPQEREAILVTELMKTPKYMGKEPSEVVAIAKQMVKEINSPTPPQGGLPRPIVTTPNPASSVPIWLPGQGVVYR